MTESEKQAASNGKKKKGAEAKEKVPWKAFLGHSFENHSYEEMVCCQVSQTCIGMVVC